MESVVCARVFWSGGSQAVRIPKALRLDAAEVRLRARAGSLVLTPVRRRDDWEGFWDRLLPLRHALRRWPVRPVERRRSL